MEICGLNDLYFGLYLLLGRKIDICGHDDPQRTSPPFAEASENMVTLIQVHWCNFIRSLLLSFLHQNTELLVG